MSAVTGWALEAEHLWQEATESVKALLFSIPFLY